MRFSLRSRITVLFLALIAGLGAVVVVSFTILTRAEIDRTIRRDVESTTAQMDRLLRERLLSLEGRTTLIADQATLKTAVQTADPATVADRVKVYGPRFQADGISVTNRKGIVLASLGAVSQLDPNQSKDVAVAQALDDNPRPWSGVRVINGRLMLETTVPLMIGQYAQGTVSAYKLIGIDTARELKQSLSTEVAFFIGGQLVGSSIDGVQTVAGSDVEPREVQLGSKSFVALSAPLPGLSRGQHGSFVVLRDKASLVDGYRQFSFAFICTLILSSIVAFLSAKRFADRITRPLDRVVVAAQKLSAGEWPEPIQIEGRDEVALLQATFNQMSETMQESQRRLLAMIDCDPLTELDNHRRFKESLDSEAARCVASGDPLSVALIDLDHFGAYNDLRGHACGDELLKKVADGLRSAAPAIGHLFRQSGDGFAVILPMTSIDTAYELAEHMRAVIEKDTEITASCGCAEAGPTTAGGSTLCLAAEIALERAKQLGRNRVGRFDKVPGADGMTDPHQLHEYMQDASLATVQALAAAVDAKDHYTRGHSQRVAEYAASLCRYVGGSQQEIDLVFRTGTLHDVGKIGVPDSVLNKPGRLTDEERAVIETHPVLGELIVRKVPQLAETLTGVRNHHERWDGKGYPDGLAGDDIPRLARILAVADTYDAMTSDRPYRQGLDSEIALAEIAKGAGSQFDPELAQAFTRMMWDEPGHAEAA